MGVYIGTSELKNAYIGEVYEYSYDFRNKTWATCQAEGWRDANNNTPSIDADGLYYSSWAARPLISLWDNLNNAKKITFVVGFKTSGSGTSSNGLQAGINITNDGSHTTGLYIGDNNNQEIQINGSLVTRTSTTKTTGTYTETMIYDLVNKTYTYSGYFPGSGSLTDAQISGIKNTDGIRFIVAYNGMRLQTVSITVE